MVQSYLKKVGHRTFTANKKGGNREFFPHFLAPFRISYCNDEELPRRDCNFNPWRQGAKLLFGRQFSVSDDADFILLQLKIGLQFQLSICPIVHCPLLWRAISISSWRPANDFLLSQIITDSIFVFYIPFMTDFENCRRKTFIVKPMFLVDYGHLKNLLLIRFF